MTSAKLVIFPETNHQFFREGGPFQIALAHNGPIAVPGITDALVWMPQNPGIFGYAVFSGLQQLVVITGLPHIFRAIEAQLLADTGRNFLNPLMSVAIIAQGGAGCYNGGNGGGNVGSAGEMAAPSVRSADAVRRARGNGHKAFLATGRNMPIISREILDVSFDGVVASAGGHVEAEGKVLFTSTSLETIGRTRMRRVRR